MKKNEAISILATSLRPREPKDRVRYDEAVKMAIDVLNKPERKTGRWIEMSSTNHTYKCSVCGRLLVNITDGKNKVAKNYPYCHCGADMRGDKHETD